MLEIPTFYGAINLDKLVKSNFLAKHAKYAKKNLININPLSLRSLRSLREIRTFYGAINLDESVKSLISLFFVIPAKAGIQCF